MKICELKTMLLAGAVRPDGPVARALLLDMLVDDAAHIELVERGLERHAMHIANLEPVHVAANFSRVLVLRGGTRLQGVVMSHEDVLALDLPPVDLEHV